MIRVEFQGTDDPNDLFAEEILEIFCEHCDRSLVTDNGWEMEVPIEQVICECPDAQAELRTFMEGT